MKKEYTTYKHTKSGNLYFPLEHSTRQLPKNVDIDDNYYKLSSKALLESTLEEVDIYVLYSNGMGLMGYLYDCEKINGSYVLYKGIDGQMWLRPHDEFHGNIELNGETAPRFEKLIGEDLFNEISKRLEKK